MAFLVGIWWLTVIPSVRALMVRDLVRLSLESRQIWLVSAGVRNLAEYVSGKEEQEMGFWGGVLEVFWASKRGKRDDASLEFAINGKTQAKIKG
ncbi:hypothetical protein KY285_020000 [Solanum tuberosum]|nr:hypothetical protein KY289_020240 [Solanum tuberosum]KAH0692903.1 hypothetical protein KY285_020000 [Solanum tuberosum]